MKRWVLVRVLIVERLEQCRMFSLKIFQKVGVVTEEALSSQVYSVFN